MRKDVTLRSVLLGATLMFGTMFVYENSEAAEKVYKLKAYNPMPATSVPTQALMKFAENVEAKSNGKIKMEVFHSGQLGSDREAIESVQMGTLDVAMSGTGIYTAFYDKAKMLDLPYLFRDQYHAKKVVNGPIGEEIFKGLEKSGLTYLATGDNGLRHISANKKIESVEDVKGLKIRVPEIAAYVAVWKSWGAIPTPIPVNELYMSLKTGVVNAQDNAPYHTVATKSYEVQSCYSMINYAWMGLTAVMNKEKFDKLPKDLQEIVKESAILAANWSFDAIEKSNVEAFEVMKKANVEVVMEPNRDSFRANLSDIYSQFSKEKWYDAKLIEEIQKVQ